MIDYMNNIIDYCKDNQDFNENRGKFFDKFQKELKELKELYIQDKRGTNSSKLKDSDKAELSCHIKCGGSAQQALNSYVERGESIVGEITYILNMVSRARKTQENNPSHKNKDAILNDENLSKIHKTIANEIKRNIGKYKESKQQSYKGLAKIINILKEAGGN